MDAPCTAETLICCMASGYGFRAGDYTLTWDGGEFDPERKVHVLQVATRDGRRSLGFVRIPANITASFGAM